MPSTGRGPGKTAPKLLHDFLHFDPLRSPPNSNYLTQSAPPVGEGPQPSPSQGSCQHDYTTKWNQSVAPPVDSRPQRGDEYKIAVVCKKCRIHADVHITYPRNPYATSPCPNEDFPLHHFLRHTAGDQSTSNRIGFAWVCSAPQCAAQLRISFRQPRLEPADKDLLTDTEKLRRRYEAVVAEDPEREGLRQATPIDALTRLRKYIKDSLNPEHTKRVFPANNKRFMEAFGVQGQDCAELLARLGFEYADDTWTLPQPPVLDDRLHGGEDSPRELLEDFEIELLAWISKLAIEQNVVNPSAGEGWASAKRDVERLLAAQGYTSYLSLKRTGGVSNEEIPYFSALGALPDFADSLVDFAFDRQCFCDPSGQSYYFECLQVLSERRNSEQLFVKVATLASQNMVSRRDLNAAYRTFNITPADAARTDDERVLNLYHVLISDAGPAAQDDARQALYKIGAARNSERLIKAAQQTIETYDDALSWIGNGVDKSTPDDMLLSVVAMKIADNNNKEQEELAQKAISIIAKERKSDVLNNWLATGKSEGFELTPQEALRHLGVESSGDVSNIDASVLPAAFDIARQEKPGEQTEKAIAVLERLMAGKPATTHPPGTWPVGLQSHGNTCYLNSLLQYYFSIAPLRDIILDYDKHKLDTATTKEKRERVGYLNVSMVEIKGGQRFAEDLKHLFERMIKASGDRVKPDSDLVCRAFLDPKDYALLSAASAIKDAPGAEANQAKSLESAIEENLIDLDEPANADDKNQSQSDASSVTLQADSTNGNELDVPMKDVQLPLTPPNTDGEGDDQKAAAAPPLPPRRFSTTKEQALAIAEEKAKQQQDVFEVNDKMMFRLRAGLVPKGQKSNGEQEDIIQDLFEIGLSETPVEDGVEKPVKHMFETSIQLNVFTEATDIYSMLDAAFDLQQTGETTDKRALESYKSIRALPPLLQINIPRIMFSESGAYKSEACLKLEDELYLDRYCEDSGDGILQKRKACWSWRKQLYAKKKEQRALSSSVSDLDGPTVVAETANYLNTLSNVNDDLESIGMNGVELDPELSAALAADAETQKSRLAALQGEIQGLEAKLKDQFDEKKFKYRLAAVMFHRGTASHGHYWTYIHDFGNQMWRSYNDETVESFDKIDDILEAKTWQAGTPTYAVYVRDDRKAEFIQPVCRKPEQMPTPDPEPQPGMEDTAMGGAESQNATGPDGDGVDPKLTVQEIDQDQDWSLTPTEPMGMNDEQPRRPYEQDIWDTATPIIRNNGMLAFKLQRRKSAGQSPMTGERASSTSPKRRHDSTAEMWHAQHAKHVRLNNQDEGESNGGVDARFNVKDKFD